MSQTIAAGVLTPWLSCPVENQVRGSHVVSSKSALDQG